MNYLKYTYVKTIVFLIYDLTLVFITYLLCRFAFIFENWNELQINSFKVVVKFFIGGSLFDLSAILYANIFFIILSLIPLQVKECKFINIIEKYIFIIVNSFGIILNLCDCIYFQYTQRRTTITIFTEFGNETNLGKIFLIECFNHWYLLLLAFFLIFLLWKFYRNPILYDSIFPKKDYYFIKPVTVLVLVPLILCGLTGNWFSKTSLNIDIDRALQYVDNHCQAAAILNTPFSIIRSAFTRSPYNVINFFPEKQLNKLYNPIHIPNDTIISNKKNVVIIIIESFAEEFIGSRNKTLNDGNYKGYTPFVDSLLNECLTTKNSFCNGYVSIDAMPAIFASIPKVNDSFIASPFANNQLHGIAEILGNWGYDSAFFHGAVNSSMGFQSVAKACGFKTYFGRDEYVMDSRFRGMEDWDGTWAIWDEEFLQFFCLKMNELKEPFISAVFTASSHHPFRIPNRYKDTFLDEGKFKLHKCIRYTDNALRLFFNQAKNQTWFNNTIFILTADHASPKVTHKEYMTDLGHFRVPIFIYDPSGDLGKGELSNTFQHIDIMPTILGLLGYDKPFFSFGKDILSNTQDKSWAMNYHNVPQYIMGDYIMQFDCNYNPIALYKYTSDPFLIQNLIGFETEKSNEITNKMRAFMQTWYNRMKNNQLNP